ncbi:PAS domain-containing protein [Cereibacter sphaeroides]|uniref:PAS domain-containing protein n=1 Tax=Cereibacter sphaeroides TaxID=1063 RepID=UPI001F33C504|nr:PAS domain-containing protein [Cereibacter sphaeroides]MCE6950664.1 PAS domain-containing protein [Cereibacter sphaeroides]
MTLPEPSRDASDIIPFPQDDEVPFGFDEIFFSRTDSRGVIGAGNSVFQRVSGYEAEQLIGAPHRIVRHPLMPRAAFHLLWDRLKAGRPTGVYVCNRSTDGRAYWVFAVVVPIRDGFLSVRIKPGSPTFARVRDIYADLLAAEAQGAAPVAGAEDLLGRLRRDGFPSYDSFQAQALAAEIGNRADAVGLPAPALAAALTAARSADRIEIELAGMRHLFRKSIMITTNLRIVASRLGGDGRALSAIADNYALLSNEMTRWIDKRAGGSNGSIAGSAAENLFLQAAKLLLEEMSANFTQDAEAGVGDPEAERVRLAEAAAHYGARAEDCKRRARSDAADLETHLAQMRHHVGALDSIRMLSRIESAVLRKTDGALDEIVGQLDAFQDEIGERLHRTDAHGRGVRAAAA